MNLLDWINQGITSLTSTGSPSINALGFHIFLALLTTMMVWFGVQEALASAHGGVGFNMAKFVEFVVLASFAYTLIEFYDAAIPGVGYSFKDFISVGSTSVANMISMDCEGGNERVLRHRDGDSPDYARNLFGHDHCHHRVRRNWGRCSRHSWPAIHSISAGR
jgi:hypothetical protein